MMPRLGHWWRRPASAQADEAVELRLLMVCMGNICRSPTAEGVLRDRLRRAGLQQRVSVDSAGTLNRHSGEAPDPRAVRQAALRGYDLSALRARQVVEADYTRFHWLLAMDEDNLVWLQQKAPPQHGARIELLMSHARRHKSVRELPDPYYGSVAGFDRVLDLVEDACDGLVAHLQRELGADPAVYT